MNKIFSQVDFVLPAGYNVKKMDQYIAIAGSKKYDMKPMVNSDTSHSGITWNNTNESWKVTKRTRGPCKGLRPLRLL